MIMFDYLTTKGGKTPQKMIIYNMETAPKTLCYNTQIYLRKIGIANGIIRNRQIGWHRFLKLAISFHSMIFVSATQLPICLPRVNTHLEECCKCESAVRHFQLGGEGPSRRGLFRDHENFVDLCFQL